MPVSKYFKNHGDEVLQSIRKAHPDYDEKRVKSEFYATANARNAKPNQKMKTRKKGSTRVDTYNE